MQIIYLIFTLVIDDVMIWLFGYMRVPTFVGGYLVINFMVCENAGCEVRYLINSKI